MRDMVADQDASTLDQRLKALSAEQNRYTRRIERVLPEIEDAFAKGVSRQAVLKELQEDGIDITMAGFAKTLYRLRKKHRGEASAANASTGGADASSTLSPAPAAKNTSAALGDMSLREIARNRPDLAKLGRLGREAAATKAKT